jgi:predicted O-methyltransferase YrrM
MALALIQQIFEERAVTDADGNRFPLHSEMDSSEGQALYDLIASDSSIRRTLEVGCAYGLSSLHICAALSGREGAKHTALDPFQFTDWHGIGAANLRRAGFDFAEVVPQFSEVALPAKLANEEGKFDLILIDGWHTHDQTTLDLYYANRLLRVGGYVVIDDANAPAVAKAVRAVECFPAYRAIHREDTSTVMRKLKSVIRRALPVGAAQWLLPAAVFDRYYLRTLYPSMAVLQKIAEDKRDFWWARTF